MNIQDRKISRRTFLKKSAYISAASLVSTSIPYTYAKKVEPTLIQVREVGISIPTLPADLQGKRIVQFSDVHVGEYYSIEQLEEAVRIINKQEADFVMFTGDLIDHFGQYKEVKKLAPALAKVQAKLGKFAIYGNHDHGGGGSRAYKEIMKEAGFDLLINDKRNVAISSDTTINIVGLDDLLLGNMEIEKTLKPIRAEEFTIVLAHEPDVADKVKEYEVDLQLSGHSHGGQIQLPFIGPLVTPTYAEKYVDGLYTLGGAKQAFYLYVNRGLGTTRLPFRFLCKPEITVLTLKKGEKR
ncbi:metallophosphoesterase [Priestia taiwanensis]|uniref:Metallophosphoesterase n=1 Tax=Priestia taiwanensis TaxID=1347902 RepID=A0A917EQQ1_9BACI|nr:metallophosphoesterase [Priestia taiwanensis]MBM7363067.1 putative MPP superfamily phosphohydrolase [Priestia taiwanensis]GGE67404.1 metallophosphoesterase [Priestia taiwanensis]